MNGRPDPGCSTSAAATLGDSVCPGCGGHLRPVGTKTVKHLLRLPLAHAVWGEGFYYCPEPECEVYYVRRAEDPGFPPRSVAGPEVYRAEHIKGRARPHARGAERLVCYCFEYTAGDIAEDARARCDSIPAAIAAEVRAGMCACEVLNPGGG